MAPTETAAKPADEPTAKPSAQSQAKPVDTPTAKPSTPTAKPSAPTAKPSTPTAKPSAPSQAKPASKPAAKTSAASKAKPRPKRAAKTPARSKAKPSAKSSAERPASGAKRGEHQPAFGGGEWAGELLDMQQQMVRSVADYQRRAADSTRLPWVATMARGQADVLVSVTDACVSAARRLLVR
jgi:outer membrane biosynthesis protein TonB